MLPYKFSDLMVYSFVFYTISKKNLNFQKIELWSPVRFIIVRFIFEQKYFGIPPYYNPRAIQKKKLKLSPLVFFLLTVDLKFNLVEFLAIHRAIPIGKSRSRGRPETTNANSEKASSSESEVSTSDCEKNREGFQEKF